jgi:hypothetical protein
MIKSRRMRWSDLVAHMERREIHTQFWSENLKRKDHLEDLGLDGRIIFNES